MSHFKVLFPRSILSWMVFLSCWGVFWTFAGMQIYHKQFIFLLSILAIAPLFYYYAVVLGWHYIRYRMSLQKIPPKNPARKILRLIPKVSL